MKTEYIQSFLAVNKYKSLSKAARSLYVSQPTLSSRISNLEQFLNVKLFDRNWNGMELTAHGILFLTYALEVVDKLENFRELTVKYDEFPLSNYEISIKQSNKTFKIGINDYLVNKYGSEIITALNKHYPKLKYEMITRTTSELMNLLDYGILDYIIYYDSESRFCNSVLVDFDKMSIILSKTDYEKVDGNFKLIKKINKPLFLNSNPILDFYLPYYKKCICHLNFTELTVMKNLQLIKLLIKENKGYTVLPKSVSESLCKGESMLKMIDMPSTLSAIPIYTTYRKKTNRNELQIGEIATRLTDNIRKLLCKNNQELPS